MVAFVGASLNLITAANSSKPWKPIPSRVFSIYAARLHTAKIV